MSGILPELQALAEPEYRDFTAKLLPGTEGILGVRLPALRRIAKRIAAGDRQAFLREEKTALEEIMVWGIVIGRLRIPFPERLRLLQDFIPAIDNWSVCDCCASGLTDFQKYSKEGLAFLAPYEVSPKEFEARFALVLRLKYYLTPEYLPSSLQAAVDLRADGYYAKMAAAWLIAESAAKDGPRALRALNLSDDLIRRKAISKICESYRVSPEIKQAARALK